MRGEAQLAHIHQGGIEDSNIKNPLKRSIIVNTTEVIVRATSTVAEIALFERIEESINGRGNLDGVDKTNYPIKSA